MKFKLPLFSAGLIIGLAIVALLAWSGSLQQMVLQQNRTQSAALKQLWESQIAHFQQKQRLWLQSQYYLISTLLESSDPDQRLQTFLWGYYPQNPNIRSVLLIKFDQNGEIKSHPPKPGCLKFQGSNQQDFKDYLLPRITSCRIADKVLLEIVGSISSSTGQTILIVSMDYFSFLTEFSIVTQKKLQLNLGAADLIEYTEVTNSSDSSESLTILLEEEGLVLGKLHLSSQPLLYFDLWIQQVFPVLLILAIAAWLVYSQFNRLLINPLLLLAQKMRDTAVNHYSGKRAKSRPVTPGLKVMHEYFHALQGMAKHDPLTGLNNRIIFEDRLLQAINEGKRSGRKYALILIDITNFDSIAHQQGQYLADALLKRIAESLLASLRESDNVSRFEKGIFAVLVEVLDPDQLVSLVEKIYQALVDRFHVYGRDLDATLGMGIAVYPEHGTEADELYQNACSALVEAEKSEWPIVFYQRLEDDTDYSGFTLIQSLRKAIENDELKLVFQPVIDLNDHSTAYFEALLRWKHPDTHTSSIERTIQIAEKNQLIKPLTNWIIAVTCKLLSELKIEGLVIGINLSMIDLHDQYLPRRIENYLNQYGVEPGQILIEITEGQIMQEPDEVIEILSHLGSMGLSLSIDDFGTGQASLTYLKDLPVEKLKIDQSFIRDMVANPDDQLIVKATIELAHTLELKVVAEGVETLATKDILREMNCDYVQGYYISRPIEAEQIPDWYKQTIQEAR